MAWPGALSRSARVMWLQWLVLVGGALLAGYAAFLVWLARNGCREDARAVVGFIPDCVVLFRRLLGDDRVPRSTKALVVVLIGYLAMPFDLVPDFIPVAGQLDDAIVVALVLRRLLRASGPDVLREHWRARPPRSTCSSGLRVSPCQPAERSEPSRLRQAADGGTAIASAAVGVSGAGLSDCSMRRAIVSIVCAYSRIASSAPSSPQPAM